MCHAHRANFILFPLSHFFIVFAAFILSLRQRKSHSSVPEIESSFLPKRRKTVKMMELMSAVDDYHVFDVEIALDNHVGVLPNPFPGMDKSTSAICNFHLRGYCQRESMCPNRHIRYVVHTDICITDACSRKTSFMLPVLPPIDPRHQG